MEGCNKFVQIIRFSMHLIRLEKKMDIGFSPWICALLYNDYKSGKKEKWFAKMALTDADEEDMAEKGAAHS